MAKMIPSMISEEEALKSPAEARIFRYLKRMEWGNAIVLHSLPLKEHIKKSFGEIDFVVICEKGVLCLEVKGGGVERKDGLWGFTNGKKETSWKNEGPYWQVQGNMKSLRQYLETRLRPDDEILKCRFACCVMTPDCVIKTDSDTEVIPEISFNANMSEADMPAIFERSFRYWEKEKHYGGHDGLSAKARERLATFLRGDFNFVPALSVLIDRSEEQLNSVTAEQRTIIENMLINKRMMIEGGAGTGKTLLAAEQCRKAYISGEKVLYMCFNSRIASCVKHEFENDPCCSGVNVFTFHELLYRICGDGQYHDEQDSYFTDVLPNVFLEKTASGLDEQYVFDRVIIDEGQDLMNTTAYLCIGEMIRGGWEKGKWTIYFDPNQNLFGTNEEFAEIWEILRESAFIYPLTVNCRNTKQIAEGNYAVSLVYKPTVMRAEGMDVVYRAYKNRKGEAETLFEEIRKLRSGGVKKDDIVILSYYRMDNPNSCLFGVEIPKDIGPIVFNPSGNLHANKNICYYTVKAFKGMEAKAVVMADVDSFSEDDKRLQNYVGMSRARSYLVLLYDEKLYTERQERLLKSLLS